MTAATAKQLWKLNAMAKKCQESKPRLPLERGALTITLPISEAEAHAKIQTLMLKMAEQEVQQ